MSKNSKIKHQLTITTQCPLPNQQAINIWQNCINFANVGNQC